MFECQVCSGYILLKMSDISNVTNPVSNEVYREYDLTI